MEKLLVGLFCFCLVTMSADCAKESDNCHLRLTAVNNSSEVVCMGSTPTSQDTLLSENYCTCKGIEPGETYEEVLLDCWEKRFNNLTVLQFFVYDYDVANSVNCNSLLINNNILKRYELTLKDLQDMDWTIEYP